MNWREKIRLVADSRPESMSQISRAAGREDTWLAAMLNKGNEPGSVTGMRLAQVLGVPAEWLWDDSQDWPPPARPTGISGIVPTQMDDPEFRATMAEMFAGILAEAAQRMRESAEPSPQTDEKTRGPAR
jgi:hypothetical protein